MSSHWCRDVRAQTLSDARDFRDRLVTRVASVDSRPNTCKLRASRSRPASAGACGNGIHTVAVPGSPIVRDDTDERDGRPLTCRPRPTADGIAVVARHPGRSRAQQRHARRHRPGRRTRARLRPRTGSHTEQVKAPAVTKAPSRRSAARSSPARTIAAFRERGEPGDLVRGSGQVAIVGKREPARGAAIVDGRDEEDAIGMRNRQTANRVRIQDREQHVVDANPDGRGPARRWWQSRGSWCSSRIANRTSCGAYRGAAAPAGRDTLP